MTNVGNFKLYRIAFLLVFLMITPSGPGYGSGQKVDEAKAIKVKAAYLYSFSKFVSWPSNKFTNEGSPIVLGILSEDAEKMKELLDSVAVSRGLIQNRRLQIKVLHYVAPDDPEEEPSFVRQRFIEDARGCHMLFVDEATKRMRQDIFTIIDEHRVLSVGGGDGFVEGGGMVALVRKGESIVFYINVASLDKEKLTISPKLLRNAELIR